MEDLQRILIYKNQNPLFNKIDALCQKYNILHEKNILIFACSGGPDSVFLAYYLHYRSSIIGFKVILAYFDHEWRKEAKDEIIFCKNLAVALGFEFCTSAASVFKDKITYQGSKEEHARELRYTFFYNILKESNAQSIVLGHHLDDQIETFFIRLFRGSSLSGLCGMKVEHNVLVRPLLEITKKEILDFLEENNISYCVDHTNDDLHFLRNKIRHTLIPQFALCDNRFTKNIAHLIKRLQNSNDFLELTTTKLYKEITFFKNTVLYICISQLLKEHPEMQYRILLRFLIENKVQFHESEKFLQEIMRFLKNKAKKHQCSKEWQLRKDTQDCPYCRKKEVCGFIPLYKTT